MTQAQELIKDIEDAAHLLGLAPSTIGVRSGQGGRFYARLKAGKRVWPETAEKVRAAIEQMKSSAKMVS